MNLPNRTRSSFSILNIYLIVFLLLMLDGCVTDKLQTFIDEIDKSRQTIENESQNWRAELPKLIQNLQGLESQVSADVKGVMTDTINQLQDLSQQTLQFTDAMATDVIAHAGTETRCTIDFVKAGTTEQLQYLVESLKFWKTNKSYPEKKPVHVVCGINPSVLSLYPTEGNWRIDTANMTNNVVSVFGYNFASTALPTLDLQDANGQTIHPVNLRSAYVTRYQINLDFANENFAGVKPGSRIIFRWPDQDDPNTMTLILKNPAKIQIVDADFTPVSPIMKKDAVTLRLTLKNEGDVRSGSFAVTWKPDPSKTQVLSMTPSRPLEAGQTIQLNFPGSYIYDRYGTIDSLLSISTGDDLKTYRVLVQTNIASISTCRIEYPYLNIFARWRKYPADTPWFTFPLTTPLHPECTLRPGDSVQISSVGGCVNTGGSGDTCKRYVDPKDGDCNNTNSYIGMIAIPGTIEESQNMTIAEFMRKTATEPQLVSSTNANPVLELGYVDDDYSDNTFDISDEGTCDQCRGESKAYISFRITHYK